MLNIAITGASGFIGKHLTDYFTDLGYQVTPLGRRLFLDDFLGELVQTIEHCDVVINLAGSSINQRWTKHAMEEMVKSRVQVTKHLVDAIKSAKIKPKLLISASAVGYYPIEGDYDEYSERSGEGFLADLCKAWEAEAKKCPEEVRLVITRFGVVLSPDGGALPQMIKPLKTFKVAIIIGPGDQSFPWIDIRDLCRAMEFILKHPTLRGVVNLVAPDLVTQYLFTRIMAKSYGAKLKITIPSFLFYLVLGKRAFFLTTGQRVFPSRMMELGFQFVSPTLKNFFKLNK